LSTWPSCQLGYLVNLVVGLVNLAIVSLVNLAILSTWLSGQLGGGQPYQLGHLINLVNLPI